MKYSSLDFHGFWRTPFAKKKKMQLVSGKGMPGYDWKKPTRREEEHGTSVTLHVTLQHRIWKSRTVTNT